MRLAIASTVCLAVAATALLHEQGVQSGLTRQVSAARAEVAQLPQLRQESHRLAQEAAPVPQPLPEHEQLELLRLRNQVGLLRAETKELGRRTNLVQTVLALEAQAEQDLPAPPPEMVRLDLYPPPGFRAVREPISPERVCYHLYREAEPDKEVSEVVWQKVWGRWVKQ